MLYYNGLYPILLALILEFMITPAQVKHIAKLARLGLKEKDIEKFSQQLSSIIEYIEKLNEVDVSNVVPTFQVTGLENVMREDQEERFSNREELLQCTELPLQNDQIKVKPVITI